MSEANKLIFWNLLQRTPSQSTALPRSAPWRSSLPQPRPKVASPRASSTCVRGARASLVTTRRRCCATSSQIVQGRRTKRRMSVVRRLNAFECISHFIFFKSQTIASVNSLIQDTNTANYVQKRNQSINSSYKQDTKCETLCSCAQSITVTLVPQP